MSLLASAPGSAAASTVPKPVQVPLVTTAMPPIMPRWQMPEAATTGWVKVKTAKDVAVVVAVVVVVVAAVALVVVLVVLVGAVAPAATVRLRRRPATAMDQQLQK